MYDRPTAADLLQAVRQHLEKSLIPLARQTHFKLYFQTLVANNVLKIVEREILLGEAHLRAEWSRLNMLTGSQAPPESLTEMRVQLADRNAALCDAIRAGDWDDSQPLFEHLKATARAQLDVANPRFLDALRAEDSA